jgi:hypothetical protein
MLCDRMFLVPVLCASVRGECATRRGRAGGERCDRGLTSRRDGSRRLCIPPQADTPRNRPERSRLTSKGRLLSAENLLIRGHARPGFLHLCHRGTSPQPDHAIGRLEGVNYVETVLADTNTDVALSRLDFPSCYARELSSLIWFVMSLGADAHRAADVAPVHIR